MEGLKGMSYDSIKSFNIADLVPRDYKLADFKYEVLKEQIEAFQQSLSDDVDVCVSFASFGTSTLMFVSDISYQNPDLMYFWGQINGNEAQLIQHVSQLNFILMAVKKENPKDQPRRIGFLAE